MAKKKTNPDTDAPAPNKEASIVETAKERYERGRDFYEDQRKLAIADTKFVMGDSDNHWQWREEDYKNREKDERVCLTVNISAQHCNQIINQIRQNRPSLKVSPADSGADKKTAEILAGLIRNIHASSGADAAHDTGAEHAIYGGEGYWRVITEYENEKSFLQTIKVKQITNPLTVIIDPDAKEPDKSDANWGFIFEDLPKDEVILEHPEITGVSDWEDTGDDWVTNDHVRVAEYFYCERIDDTLLMLSDGSVGFKSELGDRQLPLGIEVVKERKTKRKKWKWCKLLGGQDKPIEEKDWAGAYLPIISVVGKEVNVNGEVIRKGQVRDLKDPARMVNFAYSETVQTLALQNKIPYMAAAEALEGYEDEWRDANKTNLAALRYNAYDDNGNALPKPTRESAAVLPTAQVQLLQLSTEQMRAASGQQNSNFGIRSEAQSGIGIQRLKQQGEVATFHFPDNLARAMRYEGMVLLDLIQKVYDTARVVRILGLDGKEEHAKLDPQMQMAYMKQVNAEVEQIFNPTVGHYDVTIDTGPSYQTLRQEGAQNLNELAGRNPALMSIAGDIIMRAQDFPMAEQLADRLAKAVPPHLQDQPEGTPEIPPQVQAQMQQMQQQIQQMGQALQQAQEALQKAESGEQSKMAEQLVKKRQSELDDALARQKMDRMSEEAIAKAELDAKVTMDKAQKEADTRLLIAEIDAKTALKVAAINTQSKEEIEELRLYLELEAKVKAGLAKPEELAAVPKPRMMTKKRIMITAPSGGVYQGSIEESNEVEESGEAEESGEEMEAERTE